MKFVLKITFFIGLLVIASIPLVAQSSRPAGDERLDQILARLNTIEQRLVLLEGMGTPVPVATTPEAVPSVQDIEARIEAVDEQVRAVNRKRELDQDAL